jgi:hypothetical protein
MPHVEKLADLLVLPLLPIDPLTSLGTIQCGLAYTAVLLELEIRRCSGFADDAAPEHDCDWESSGGYGYDAMQIDPVSLALSHIGTLREPSGSSPQIPIQEEILKRSTLQIRIQLQAIRFDYSLRTVKLFCPKTKAEPNRFRVVRREVVQRTLFLYAGETLTAITRPRRYNRKQEVRPTLSQEDTIQARYDFTSRLSTHTRFRSFLLLLIRD